MGTRINGALTNGGVLPSGSVSNSELASGIDAAKLGDGSVSNTEFQRLNGVSGDIQTQIDGKQATITGAATTIDTEDLTASRALVSDGSGKVAAAAATTATEVGYLSGVTSAIQTQLDSKVGKSGTDDVKSKDMFIASPTSSDDWPSHRFEAAATLTKVVYTISGSTNVVCQLQEADDAIGTNAADTQSADSTVTTTTTVTSFTNASIAAGHYVRLKVTSVSGTPDWVHVTYYYTVD